MTFDEIVPALEQAQALNRGPVSDGASSHWHSVPRLSVCVSPDLVMDAAFGGDPCEVLNGDGTISVLQTSAWTSPVDEADTQLFLTKCNGSTLDVGCGPGRLAGALVEAGHETLGIDISAEAVRQTQGLGCPAVHADVLSHSCDFGEHLWEHILLADGNIGIGGNPVRLLRRLARHLHPEGTMLVEVEPTDLGLVSSPIQLRTKHLVSEPFDWARVGLTAIEQVAREADLRLHGIAHSRNRALATLVHREPGAARR